MTAQDVVMDAAERGWAAAVSDGERQTLMNMVKIFKGVLLARIGDGDAGGVMAATCLFQDGEMLGSGVVLTLEDRALFGWMKGLLKKPVVAEVPLSSIAEVSRGVKEPTRRMSKRNRAIFVGAAERWELLTTPAEMPEEPVYDLVAGLLSGNLKIDDLQAVGDTAA